MIPSKKLIVHLPLRLIFHLPHHTNFPPFFYKPNLEIKQKKFFITSTKNFPTQVCT